MRRYVTRSYFLLITVSIQKHLVPLSIFSEIAHCLLCNILFSIISTISAIFGQNAPWCQIMFKLDYAEPTKPCQIQMQVMGSYCIGTVLY